MDDGRVLSFADDAAPSAKAELRLWLRLLTTSGLIEGEVRTRLRDQFGVTLPRFDLMAQLARSADGLTMGELSRRMMVSNGNTTGVVDRLVADGLVLRTVSATDRRVQHVRLTVAGRAAFAAMAAAHERWIGELFAGLTREEEAGLMRLLARAKQSVRDGIAGGGA